jgi:hypothetical protein
MFNKRTQSEGESFEHYLSALRTLIKSCNYCGDCVSSMLRDRVVLGIRDAVTQQMLLRERKLTLDKTVDICKAAENAATQSKAYREESETVHKVNEHRKISRAEPKLNNSVKLTTSPPQQCRFCGFTHILLKDKCPAWGKVCKSCKGKNHFATQCTSLSSLASRRKEVHCIQDTESDE